ncbi:MAG: alpha/beta hydrolase [Pseudomonadota bacterium]
MAKIKVNDVEFYYELHGQGEPLILISGYAEDCAVWRSFLARLGKKFQVLIFDNQGVGQTQDQGKPLTADIMADNTVALAKTLGFSKFHVLGHSMGGNIAQMIALRHPDVVNKLVISCSSPAWNGVVLKEFESILRILKAGTPVELVFDLMAPWCYGADFMADSVRMEKRKKQVLENPYPASIDNIQRQFEVLKNFESTKLLRKIKTPTLIISAFQDIIATLEETKKLIAGIPNATHKQIQGGHSLPIEVADEWLDCVLGFLGYKEKADT